MPECSSTKHDAPTRRSWIRGIEIPDDWDLRRGRYVFQRMRRSVDENDEVVTAFRDGTVTLRSNRRETGFTFSEKEIGYQGVRKGDLVVHAMDGFAGAIGVSDADGKATPVYSVLQPLDPSGTCNGFYAYLLRHLALSGYVAALTRGIRERSTEFRFREIQELWLPRPPAAVQHAIANFLDRETAKIDALVAKKERLIELLQEKRTTLITHAVTKGMDPDVPMKNSGVEWLGEIPRHWEVQPVKRVVKHVTSGSRAWSEYFSERGAIFLQSGNLNRRLGVELENVQYVDPPTGAEGERTLVRRGDVLVCITGALTGNVAFVDRDLGEAYVNQHVALLRPIGSKITGHFLALALGSLVGWHQFLIAQYGGTKQGLGLEDVS